MTADEYHKMMEVKNRKEKEGAELNQKKEREAKKQEREQKKTEKEQEKPSKERHKTDRRKKSASQ